MPFSFSLDSYEQGIVDKYQTHINRVKDVVGCVIPFYLKFKTLLLQTIETSFEW